MRILVTGARAPIALEWARILRRAGHIPYLADSMPSWTARFSNAPEKVLTLPPPRYALKDFENKIIEYVTDLEIDYLLPTCEEIFYIAQCEKLQKHNVNIFLTDIQQLKKLHSKFDFIEIAKKAGAHPPDSVRITDKQGLEALENKASKLVFKPEYSRFASHVLLKPHSTQLSNLKPTENYPWIAQDYISGQEYCSFGLAYKGRLGAHVVYAPRYRLGTSSSYFFETVLKPEIQDFVSAFVAETSFTGQIGFDIILTEDNQVVPLECNPRGTSGLHLMSAPDHIAGILTGDFSEIHSPAAGTTRMIKMAMLTLGLPNAIRQGNIKAFRKHMKHSRDVISNGEEIMPVWGNLLDLSYYLYRGIRHLKNPVYILTTDIEWNGDQND